MSVSKKIKALLQLRGKRRCDLAAYLNITNQSLSNKFNRGSFSTEDLIKIAEFSNSKLCIEIDSEQKIFFNANDIRIN